MFVLCVHFVCNYLSLPQLKSHLWQQLVFLIVQKRKVQILRHVLLLDKVQKGTLYLHD